MKKVVLVLALVLAFALPVFAQEFPDVPSDHWAYQAVQELLNAGIVQGYPDGTYGGKRAMTRYEFAEAIAKAIPVIEERVLAQCPQPPAAQPQPPAVDTSNLVTKDQFNALQRLVDEFRDELAALGVDVEALRRDVAALNERVTALEAEVARVRFSGNATLYGRGEVSNDGSPLDIDGRDLPIAFRDSAGNLLNTDADNPLANSDWFNNLDFGMKAKAGEAVNLNAQFMVGDYMEFALEPGFFFGGTGQAQREGFDDFILWNLNVDAGLRFLGDWQIVAGRQSFQLTPLTLQFVDPDWYTNVPVLDSGDFVLDGVRGTVNFGSVALTAFGAKPADELFGSLQTPTLLTDDGYEVSQLGGVRAVIGNLLNGNLGLTWYEAGLDVGRTSIMGADFNGAFGKLGFGAEYATTDPNDEFIDFAGAIDEDNSAWNAKLNYAFGKLGVGAGYKVVEANYNAPGYWFRAGQLVNLQNIKGFDANINYPFSSKLGFYAKGQFIEPNDTDLDVSGRNAVFQGQLFSADGDDVDKLTNYEVGVNLGIGAANSVNLSWQESKLDLVGGGDSPAERYITLGLGHTFNQNAGMKLLYQIVQLEGEGFLPDYRGGVAAATFNVKY